MTEFDTTILQPVGSQSKPSQEWSDWPVTVEYDFDDGVTILGVRDEKPFMTKPEMNASHNYYPKDLTKEQIGWVELACIENQEKLDYLSEKLNEHIKFRSQRFRGE
tara:strand:+ start:155 stop:472 length:318 start_codon:yes stop_codon:yes gene_type:complete